jgi:hypothetical protein
MTDKEEHDILKAQSALLIHLIERVVMLQVSFETYIRDQVGESGPKHDAHYARRKELFEQDFRGHTTDLLNTLRQAMRKT